MRNRGMIFFIAAHLTTVELWASRALKSWQIQYQTTVLRQIKVCHVSVPGQRSGVNKKQNHKDEKREKTTDCLLFFHSVFCLQSPERCHLLEKEHMPSLMWRHVLVPTSAKHVLLQGSSNRAISRHAGLTSARRHASPSARPNPPFTAPTCAVKTDPAQNAPGLMCGIRPQRDEGWQTEMGIYLEGSCALSGRRLNLKCHHGWSLWVSLTTQRWLVPPQYEKSKVFYWHSHSWKKHHLLKWEQQHSNLNTLHHIQCPEFQLLLYFSWKWHDYYCKEGLILTTFLIVDSLIHQVLHSDHMFWINSLCAALKC